MQMSHVNFPSKDFQSKYIKSQYNVIPVLLGNKEGELLDIIVFIICSNIQKEVQITQFQSS